MHRDQRIGLALGILLVGAVAAFFFRNEEAQVESNVPTLKTAAEIDQEIAQKDRIPYLQPGAAGQPSASPKSPPPLPDDFPSLTDDGAAVADQLVPEPIAMEEPITVAPSSSAGGHDAGGKHIVAKGETLSSIATQRLGNATRFLEIYEANRDQLRNPNDLRVGMELVIPPRDVRTAAAVSDKAPTAAERAATEDNPVPSAGGAVRKFERVRRSPLVPLGEDPQSSQQDPKESARRRLSQLPPRGAAPSLPK